MKKMLCKLVNKISNIYGSMSNGASVIFFAGQTKAPNCLVKKD